MLFHVDASAESGIYSIIPYPAVFFAIIGLVSGLVDTAAAAVLAANVKPNRNHSGRWYMSSHGRVTWTSTP